MSNINLYYHTGSANHGCEAIVRGTANIIQQPLTLFSFEPEQDFQYGLDKIVKVKEDRPQSYSSKSFKGLLAALQYKFLKKTLVTTQLRKARLFAQIKKGDVCMSIGGDNYTYQGTWELADYNQLFQQRGAKTVLWGCSIDSNLIPKLKADLSRYDLIIARETLTYRALKENRIAETVRLCPDPAFQLQALEAELPQGLEPKKTIGINLSPLILKYGNSELILKNFENLIQHLIATTDFQIALIPHVVTPGNSDYEIMENLYRELKSSDRVLLVKDTDCRVLKHYISNCRFFMGARTHATIAAYSTKVPTIVVGYSMKAKGIAKDIFGTDENYVCPVQNFTKETELIDAFQWLAENESAILSHYNQMMDDYKKEALRAADYLNEIR